MKHFAWGTKVFIKEGKNPIWIAPSNIKDVAYNSRLTDRELYQESFNKYIEKKLLLENVEWEVAAVIKVENNSFYLLKDGFNNAITIELDNVFKKGKVDITSAIFTFDKDYKIKDNQILINYPTQYSSGYHYLINSINNDCLEQRFKNSKLTICGPHTKLNVDGKTYSTTCSHGDVMDREKAVMLLLLQSQGISYGKIQRLIEDAKMYEWKDPKIYKDKDVKAVVNKLDEMISYEINSYYDNVNSVNDENTPVKKYFREDDTTLTHYIEIKRLNTYEFNFKIVNEAKISSNKVIYLPINCDIYNDMKGWIEKKTAKYPNIYDKEKGVLVGTKEQLKDFTTFYNMGIAYVQKTKPTLFNWESFDNPTGLHLALTKIGDQKLRVTYMAQKDKKSLRTIVKKVTRDNVPISQEESNQFNQNIKERIIAPLDTEYANWIRFMDDRFNQLQEQYIKSLQ